MTLEIRDFIEDDRDFFLEASEEFYDSDAVEDTVPEKNFQRTFDVCLEGSPFVQGMVFLVDGQPAGYALISITYSNEVGGLSILLEEAYIRPSFQGLGIGTRFFELVEEHYVEAGKAKRLRLEVTKVNTGAISLYERMGYQPLSYVQMVKDFD